MASQEMKPKYCTAYGWYIKVLSRGKKSFKCLALSKSSFHIITFDNEWLDGTERAISKFDFDRRFLKFVNRMWKGQAA